MEHILLRHKRDILLHGLEIGVQVTIVQQDCPFARQHPTGHDVHQRGLARAVGTDDGDKFAREDAQVGALQNTAWYSAGLSAAHIVADAPDQQLDIANAPYLGERSTVERQLEWADINTVTLDQATSAAQTVAVDIGTVGAPEVTQHNGSIHDLERRVTARDIRMIEDDLPWYRLTADGQTVAEGHPVAHRGDPVCIHLYDPRPEPSQPRSTSPLWAHPPLSFRGPHLHKHT